MKSLTSMCQTWLFLYLLLNRLIYEYININVRQSYTRVEVGYLLVLCDTST